MKKEVVGDHDQRSGSAVICRRCSTEFTPAPGRLKGKNFVCNACHRKYVAAWRQRRGRRTATELAWVSQYYARPEVKAARSARKKKYSADPNIQLRDAARYAVKKAIRAGQLERKPCEVCGEPKTEAHHPDYHKPLDVQWLCHGHHRDVHYPNRRAAQ